MLGIGIIGTNYISDWFYTGCDRSGVARPVAVMSRDRGRGAEFARRYELPHTVANLDDLLAIDAVEAVYVASPIAAHYEQVVAALKAGRHVLCEKTLCATAEQTREVFDLARAQGLVLAEAIRPIYDPDFLIVEDHLARLGPVRHVSFEKQQYSQRYDRFKAGEVLNAFNPDLANAAVSDIGIYCIAPALYLFGMPASVRAAGIRLANGFEGAGTMLLSYPDTVVSCTWSKITGTRRTPSVIHGELGTLSIDHISGPAHVAIDWRQGDTEVLLDREPKRDADNMHHEVAAFAARIAGGEPDERREQVSIAARELIDDYLATVADEADETDGTAV